MALKMYLITNNLLSTVDLWIHKYIEIIMYRIKFNNLYIYIYIYQII